MDAYEYDYQVNRPEKEFPLARTQYKKLYIDAAKGALSFEPVAKESSLHRGTYFLFHEPNAVHGSRAMSFGN